VPTTFGLSNYEPHRGFEFFCILHISKCIFKTHELLSILILMKNFFFKFFLCLVNVNKCVSLSTYKQGVDSAKAELISTGSV